jgi:hypothetical protein
MNGRVGGDSVSAPPAETVVEIARFPRTPFNVPSGDCSTVGPVPSSGSSIIPGAYAAG